MFSHITLGTNDLAKTEPFYDAIMAVLAHPKIYSEENAIGYGSLTGQIVFIMSPFNKNPAMPGNGVHAAFLANSRNTVDQFYERALANGGTCDGKPGLRSYHANYYGAYARDPDGNKLQAVCHRKADVQSTSY